MQRSPIPLLLTPALLALPAVAQQQNANFCNDGLIADGYVDFADMPAPPNFPNGGTSAPITATLPVRGIAGLTVQVIIPALQSPFNASGGPVYTVSPGSIQFNGTSGSGVELQFSAPVQGVGSANSKIDRGLNVSLGTQASDFVGPQTFRNSATNYTMYPSVLGFNLQMVDLTKTFTSAFVGLPGNIDYEDGLTLSNVRVESTHAAADREAELPRNGLQLWLRSEDINSEIFASPGFWPDRSGTGRNAVPQPGTTPGALNFVGNACQSAYTFGTGYFNFNLPIDGWTAMTVFLVGSSTADTNNYASDNAAIFWTENSQWGNTFVSPYQTHAAFRFGTTQAGNQPLYTRRIDIGQDFTVTRAVHNQTTDALYVNGALVLSQAGKFASLNGTTGAGTIGRGLNGTPFQGAVSEILVFNRVLTETEAGTVETYLRGKFRTP